MSYAISTVTPLNFETALFRVREALASEGFDVVYEVDVQALLRERLGAEIEPYVVLAVCNPALAHEAIEHEPDLGVVIPCNVVLRLDDGETVAEAIDPVRMLGAVGKGELEPIAAEIRQRLVRVVETVSGWSLSEDGFVLEAAELPSGKCDSTPSSPVPESPLAGVPTS